MINTKIRILLIFTAFVLQSFMSAVSAFQYNGLNYNVTGNSTVSVGSNKSVTGDIVIPEKITYGGIEYTVTGISKEAFKDSQISSVKMPNTLVSIEDDAFLSCENLTSIVVPNSVTSIGNGSFAFCSKLNSLQYGVNVNRIGKDIFTGLSSLETVISLNPTPPAVATWGTTKTSATLYVPEQAISAYKLADVWKNFASIKAYTGPDPSVLAGDFSNLEELVVGNCVDSIPDKFFSGCSKLKTLSLGCEIKAIGDEAFSGCTALTEVIVPPSVETIGASAFAGNTKLASIIMGHNVKTIGEKAYDGCPANTVSITAQTPPTAPNNTFSNYTGKLYLQGQKAIDAYYDAYTCWDRFNSYAMIEPTEMKYEGSTKIEGNPGDTIQLIASLMPENVTLPQVFWRSTNPDIATVDENGLVTLHADPEDVVYADSESGEGATCKIIAESLYANGPVLEVTVTTEQGGVDEILVDDPEDTTTIDPASPYDVYNLSGVWVGDSLEGLSHGFYIVRQGSVAKKIAIK